MDIVRKIHTNMRREVEKVNNDPAAPAAVVDLAAAEEEEEQLEDERHLAALRAVFGLLTCDEEGMYPLQGATPCMDPDSSEDFLVFQLEKPPERVPTGSSIVDAVTGETLGGGTWYYPARQFIKVLVDARRPDLGLQSDSWELGAGECNVVASHVKIVGSVGESPILSRGVSGATG
mmetsp:Transcript_28374/g.69913  ORF Transcript_28374/g.69913 Transcript_28374/m.69913 type:complete len:176 (+) Transcript_28374:583-1110(+)